MAKPQAATLTASTALNSQLSTLDSGLWTLDSPMPDIEIRKQISIFVKLSDWKAIRLEAARRRIPMTELCRQWMKRDLEELKRRQRKELRIEN